MRSSRVGIAASMLAAAAAMSGGFALAVEAPSRNYGPRYRFPERPAPTGTFGRSGAKLAKLAAKGGIGIRKHW